MKRDRCWWCHKPESMNVRFVKNGHVLLCDDCDSKLFQDVIEIVYNAIQKVAKKK
jgi:hypothetical protein